MPEAEEIERWHRWFAIECNNAAWALADSVGTDEESRAELLLTAYASAFHWGKVGEPINAARADLLVAHAHCVLGQGDEAMRFARRCLSFCGSNDCEDWDLAFAHAAVAHAAACQGDTTVHAEHHARAQALGETIADEEDRAVFFEQFSRLPAPA